jgi:alkylhydroperoxidase/carboxymuconolactone decarboxylase family protein YurZ
MTAETPVLDTIADITAASLAHNSLAPRELMLVRIAALIAVNAPPASYLANAGAAAESGVTADDVQAVMIGVAPVVGTPRVVSAGGNILRALGFAIAVAEAEMADEADEADALQ